MPVSAIRPNARQPRQTFPRAGIEELASSIREVGVLQPLVVRSTTGGFELIAGERRLRAAKEAGLDRVPVLIRQAGDNESMELALVENLQRENLSPLETAAAYQALMEGFGLTKDQLARRLGKSRAAVTNTLRLAQLPASIREMLGQGQLSEGHARALLGLQAEDQMVRLARRVNDEKLSVRQTEELVREQANVAPESAPTGARPATQTPAAFNEASRVIREAIELPVRVKSFRRGGKVEIRFTDQEQLEALVDLLTAGKAP
ncbi:ParB/RepB/Spo0J family partition protein [Rubrobacter tropicus]|uniref:ParB/RepB/Spo0J family partition protein n=1 Tax=Rubrobacter tropicus TaxID=2653851 RepID=UPI001D180215|nr:ParB/RepB/Spo0J family partition protein [Rubrobacter tropicus]